MTSPRTPRVFHVGDKIPEWKYTRFRTVDGQFWQRRVDRDPMSLWWGSDNGDGKFGPDRLIEDVLTYFGTLVEVLPETPEPAPVPAEIYSAHQFDARQMRDPDQLDDLCTCGEWVRDRDWAGHHAEETAKVAVPAPVLSQDVPIPLSESVEAETATEGGRADLRAQLIEALRLAAQTRPEDIGVRADHQWYVDEFAVDCEASALYAVLAHGLAAAGWRPPLPEGEDRPGHGGDPVRRAQLAEEKLTEVIGWCKDADAAAIKCVHVIDRIRAVLADPMLDEAMMLDQVNAILDAIPSSLPPADEPACTCEYPYDGAPGSGHHPGCDVFGPPLPPAGEGYEAVRRTVGPWSVVEPVEPKRISAYDADPDAEEYIDDVDEAGS